MALDILKRSIPDLGSNANGPANFEAFSLTIGAPVECATITEANTIAGQLAAAGHTQAFPFYAFVQDLQRHMCLTEPGEEWIILGGRLHGAHVRVDRTADPGVVTEMHINSEGFLRQSVGFTRASNGGLLIPESGLYRVRLGGKIASNVNSADPGRRFVALLLNGENIGGHTEYEGDTHFHHFDEWPFEKGDVLMPICYQNVEHRDTKVKGRKIVEATLGVYQSLNPSW